MKVEFEKISDESRIWVYQSNNDFTESDVDIINKSSMMNNFIITS